MNKPKTTVTFDPAPGPTGRPFSSFEVGDWLLSQTGNLGIKVDATRIRYFTTNDGKEDGSMLSLTGNIPPTKRYFVPKSVALKVTL